MFRPKQQAGIKTAYADSIIGGRCVRVPRSALDKPQQITPCSQSKPPPANSRSTPHGSPHRHRRNSPRAPRHYPLRPLRRPPLGNWCIGREPLHQVGNPCIGREPLRRKGSCAEMGNLCTGLVLKGHDFSRAEKATKSSRALAPEGTALDLCRASFKRQSQ